MGDKPSLNVMDSNKVKEKNLGKTSLTEIISEQNFVDLVTKQLTKKEKMTSDVSKFEKILNETKTEETEVAKNLIQQQKISKKPELENTEVEPIRQLNLVKLTGTKQKDLLKPEVEETKLIERQTANIVPTVPPVIPIQSGFNKNQDQKQETKESTAKVNLGGNVRFEIVTTPQVDTKDMEQYVNSPEFKNKFYGMLLNIDGNQRINLRNTLGIG